MGRAGGFDYALLLYFSTDGNSIVEIIILLRDLTGARF